MKTKTNDFIKAILIAPFFLMSGSCNDHSNPIKPINNDLTLEVKQNIAEAAKKFNATITRNSILNLRKEAFKNIPNSIFIKDYLSKFKGQDREVMDIVLNNRFFTQIFDGETNARGLRSDEVPLSVPVQEYMLKLDEIISNTIQSSATSGDLVLDQESVSQELIEKLNAAEVTMKSDNRLGKVDVDILLMTLEFHKSTIPTIIDLLVTSEQNSTSGKVNWSWRKFWTVVAVIVVTAVAVAVIGAAVGAAWATAQGLSAAAITAASYSGLYIGAGIGAFGGLIAGSSGYCPDNWFDGGVPLVDWTTNCNDYI